MDTDYSKSSAQPDEDPPNVRKLDFRYHIFLHYLLSPVHQQMLERLWRYMTADVGTGSPARYLRDMESWEWVDRTAVSVPDDLTRHVSPEIVGLTEAGRAAVGMLSPEAWEYVIQLNELSTIPPLPTALETWAMWAVGYALEEGNNISGAPFRYEVRCPAYAPYLNEVVKPNALDYWVQFWPLQGHKRPCLGVCTNLDWTTREDSEHDPHHVNAFKRKFSEHDQDDEDANLYTNWDALYWVALTPEVAAALSTDLDWFLTHTRPPESHPRPRPDVAVFTLEALFAHWLPAPYQLRRWRGKPPEQCRAARPAYFQQEK